MKNRCLNLVLLTLSLAGSGSCTHNQQIIGPSDPIDSIVGNYSGTYNSRKIDHYTVTDTTFESYPITMSVVKNGKDSFKILGVAFISSNSWAYNSSNNYNNSGSLNGAFNFKPDVDSFYMQDGYYYLGGLGYEQFRETINAVKVK